MALRSSASDSVELLDAGVRRRLERFGRWTIDRPAPGAEGFRRATADAWDAADLRFDAGAGWSGPAWPADPWPIHVHGLTLELRPTASGGIGLYPEHATNIAWLSAMVGARSAIAEEPVRVLNLFAHTGLATLALVRAGAEVTHVDGARSAVAWARHNAALSALGDAPIRWIVDDAVAFATREARRERRYDGIVLDPPAFGRGRGRDWRLESGLSNLLAACRAVAAPGAFVLLTAHSEAIDGGDLRSALSLAFGVPPGSVEIVPLQLTATSGATLSLGWAARLGG